jgi:hypothetical protein
VSTYDEYAVKWRETQLKSALRKIFEVEKQPQFQLDELLDAMSGVPQRAISGLLSDIVGNRSFRIRVGAAEGYIVYRNNYFMFQPDYLSDIRVPLALRVADVPVKRDAFDPAAISLEEKPAMPIAPTAAAAAAPEEAAAAKPEPVVGTLQEYWRAISRWAAAISTGSKVTNMPQEVRDAYTMRYVGDEQKREESWLIMISWLYEHIYTTQEYRPEQKAQYFRGLAETLLQFIWDESLRPNEQLQLILAKDEAALRAAGEQLVTKDGITAFRFVDSITGVLKYMCGMTPCVEAVRKEFEANPADPLRGLVVNTETTGALYGFNVPKAKERRLIFKTSSPPAPGGKLDKGGECAIISAISFHITMLKQISDLLVAEGFPRFILTETILDEKARKKAAKAAGMKVTTEASGAGSARTFENAVRACALKDIILRWMDIMKAGTEPRKRYFYRPVAAQKSGHKGAVQKI